MFFEHFDDMVLQAGQPGYIPVVATGLLGYIPVFATGLVEIYPGCRNQFAGIYPCCRNRFSRDISRLAGEFREHKLQGKKLGFLKHFSPI